MHERKLEFYARHHRPVQVPSSTHVINIILSCLAPTGELVCIGVARKPLELETNIFLTKGYKIK